MCHTLGVPWRRPMTATMSPQELFYEQILMAFLVPYVYKRMEPGPKNRRLDRPADPQSDMAVVGNMNRLLGRHSDDRFSTRQAKQVLTGLLVSHDIVDTHGPVQPDRQLHFSREILTAILKLPQCQLGTTLSTSPQSRVRLSRPYSKRLCSLVFASIRFQSYPRRSGPKTNCREPCSISKYMDCHGVIYHNPDEATRMSMKHSNTIILIPATSKCDRWGRIHGGVE